MSEPLLEDLGEYEGHDPQDALRQEIDALPPVLRILYFAARLTGASMTDAFGAAVKLSTSAYPVTQERVDPREL